MCTLYTDVGEVCKCESLNSTWYLGENCDMPIQKIPFYAGLSVTLVVMLAAVGGLVAYTVVNKNKQSKKKDMKEKLVNEWMDDDVEWSRSTSPSGAAGAKKNMYEVHQTHPSTYDSHRSTSSVGMFIPPQTMQRMGSSFSNVAHTEPGGSTFPTMMNRTNLPVSVNQEEEKEYKSLRYDRVPTNLNEGTAGPDVFLWYKKESSKDPIRMITLLVDPAAPRMFKIAKATVINKNLNEGNKGTPEYLCFSRF
ncbi:PREDICTED: uncharacterized protein LOC107100679 [Cyprinodon variegatus]|uniref:uncharacterized protein LOC107100679 n=1 Tax=Cyprinodon variegatus TaxID=28743 RepID=UPI0007428113|nr:PREDICTED: uncharacterized protein LOC107100679 [Cyprinodon variegatus]